MSSHPPPQTPNSIRSRRFETRELVEIIRNAMEIYDDQWEQESNSIRAVPRYQEDYNKLTGEEKEKFHEFLELGSICPICKAKNHINYLKKFYFNKKSDKINLKNSLLKLMEQSKDFSKNISIGIPCCSCYRKVFNQNKSNLTISLNRSNSHMRLITIRLPDEYINSLDWRVRY